ncbi:Meiotic expression up-regulated protein 26 [Ceratocystis fimbriata CBS 114723]|uniref:Meiotic expression up-regulated protein 26 n=1 Tax=Ceratocystis fimbriata CBS 114723 TaxID=1035309 RepID=A0A2C5WTK5_9PEZI|nr:Meiotic expression up-regulated protein 26 [Ceratocystis fimbriata CBS 114723]
MDNSESQIQQQSQSHLDASSFAFSTPAPVKYRHDDPPRSTPMVTMTPGDMAIKAEATVSPGMWQTPASAIRPRPATIHEGFSSCCTGDDHRSLPAWDSSTMSLQQTPSDTLYSSRPVSMHQDFLNPMNSDYSSWASRKCDEGLEFPDMQIGQAYTADEAIPILDLRFQNPQTEGMDGTIAPRRMSGSSFTMSTNGTLSDMPSYEDFSSALSEAPSLSSDYPPPSNRTSLLSSCTQLSPVASPRMSSQGGRTELVRTQSRGHASPSPRPNVRSTPYNVDVGRANNKRWSTGSYGTQQNRNAGPYSMYHAMPTTQDSSTVAGGMPLEYSAMPAAQQNPYMLTGTPYRNSMLLPTQLPSQVPSHTYSTDMNALHVPPPLMSHGLFRMLQSNGDPYAMPGHYGDLSDPPDLYSALNEQQIPPPPEDMNPSDPDLVPHEQELRFEGDLYTPRWVRGHGNKREGWCGICKPGRWLVLKNSAYWYDKSFTHGISATTGSPFQEPLETRRMDGNPDVWEGLCGSCNDWIALVSSKKKGTTWFRHAYKCHTHPKIKDAPKRRRESNQNRSLAASTMAKPKVEPQMPHTPPGQHMDPNPAMAMGGTGTSGGDTGAVALSMPPATMSMSMIPTHMMSTGSTPAHLSQPTPPHVSAPPMRPVGQFSRGLPPPISEGAPPGMI